MPKTSQVAVSADSGPAVFGLIRGAGPRAGVNIAAISARRSTGPEKARLEVGHAYTSAAGSGQACAILVAADPERVERALG